MPFDRTAWVSLTSRTPPHEPRPWAEVVAELDAAKREGCVDVFVGGGEPTRSPDLLKVLRRMRDDGLQSVLVTDGRALGAAKRLDAVHDAGARLLAVQVHGASAAAHEAVAGPGAWQDAQRVISALASHALPGALLLVLDASTAGQAEGLVDLASAHGLGLRLVRRLGGLDPRDPPPAAAVVAAIDRAWKRAAQQHVRLDLDGFAWNPPASTEPAPLPAFDRNLVAMADLGFVPPSVAGGLVLAGPDRAARLATLAAFDRLDQATRGLAVQGVPVRDLPVCLGGDGPPPEAEPAHARQPGCAPCPQATTCCGVPVDLDLSVAPPPAWSGLPPGARVAVLWPWQHDRLMVASTLPALAHALRAQGVHADLLGRWDLDWNPDDLSSPYVPTRAELAWSFVYRTITRRPDPLSNYAAPDGLWGHPFRWSEPTERAEALLHAWWRDLDLEPYDLVIAPGWDVARRALEHPTCTRARVLVADFHMLAGAHPWVEARRPAGTRPRDGAWWPGDRLQVHACFPRFGSLYRALGIPMHAVHWRPYPLWLPHVPFGPEPSACEAIFSGGRHNRDFEVLAEAGRALRGSVHPIRVHAESAELHGVTEPFDHLGVVELPEFVATIRTSRFVVLPLLAPPLHAAGISVAALALAAGRPVVATRTPAMLDHVRHGVNGLLVEPRDPVALARAIRALEEDEALLARLAAGARDAAQNLSVTAWATTLVKGAPSRATWPAPGADHGTAYAWP